MVRYLGGKGTGDMVRVGMTWNEKGCRLDEGWQKMSSGFGERGDSGGELKIKAPDLAAWCSGGQESVPASGLPWSWKQQWGKSDSNLFSGPGKNMAKRRS